MTATLQAPADVIHEPRIHLTTFRSLISDRDPQRTEIPWSGQTFAEVLALCLRSDWPDPCAVCVSCNGRELKEENLPEMVPPEAWITVAPRIAGAALIFVLGEVVLPLAVGMALGYVAQVLTGTKKVGVERGDQSSPAQTWDGIHTSRGPGMRKPRIYGEVDTGGHVISTKLYELNGVEYVEELVLLSSGRIDSVGGVDGGEFGEADDLGTLDDPFNTTPKNIPEHLRINGVTLTNEDCIVSLRLGEIRQSPVQGFVQASTTEDVGVELNDKDAVRDYEIVDPDSTRFFVRFSFPGGLYEIDNGNYLPYVVGFDVQWKTATTNWTAPFRFDVNVPVRTSGFVTITPGFSFDGVKGPFQIRVKRVTAANNPGKQAQSQCTWSKVIHDKQNEFGYPGSAYMAIRYRGTERLQGSSAQYIVGARGVRLRVWDDTINGGALSPGRYWSTPTGADLYAGIWTYPVGNNPAWIALDLLLDEKDGLGRQITADQIDLQSFRDWADHCDEAVPGVSGNEARYRCDGVIDRGESAMDVLQAILAAGRGALVQNGQKIAVVYWYRDAHGRGTNSVPARGTAQGLISTSSIAGADFKLSWRDPASRPSILDVQIVNAALDYARDSIMVPDPVNRQTPATLTPKGFFREPLSLLMVTRETQAKREAYWIHAQNRLCKTDLELATSVEALPFTPGDVVNVEFNGIPFYNTAAYGYRTGAATTAAATLVLDHDITASGWQAQVVQTDGTLATVTITNGTYAAGTLIPISASITCKKGAPVALGVSGKITKPYQIVSGSTNRMMVRRLRLTEWHADAYDEIPSSMLGESSSTVSTDDTLAAPAGAVENVVLRRAVDGRHILSFRNPDGFGDRPTRIYYRPTGGKSWQVLSEVTGQRADLRSFLPGRSVELSLGVQERSGNYQLATQGTRVTLTPPEWPIVDSLEVLNLAGAVHPDGLLLTWSPIDEKALDYFEIRRGTYWLGSQFVARVREPFFFVRDAAYGAQRYMVRARHVAGPYSGAIAAVSLTFPGPQWLTSSTTQTDLNPSLLGTADAGLSYDGTNKRISLATGKCRGLYTGLQINLGSVQRAWWGPKWDTYELQTFTEAELAALDESEQRWWTELGREASPASPGADFDATESVAGMELETDTKRMATGTLRGFVGTHTRVRAEMRFDTSGAGAWTSWLPLRACVAAAQKFETRFTFDRWHMAHNVYLNAFATAVLV